MDLPFPIVLLNHLIPSFTKGERRNKKSPLPKGERGRVRGQRLGD
jgi:hypothetical protein